MRSAFISLPRRGQVMQILHHADLASMAASGGLNLVAATLRPIGSRVSIGRSLKARSRNENLCTGRRRHRTDDRMVPCRGRARRHDRRPACFHRERSQRRQWGPALLRVRGAAGVSGNAQEAAIAAAVAGFADADPRRPRSRADLLGRAIPARLPAGSGARDHCSAARARRPEPERTGAAFPKLDAFVRTADRRQACGIPQPEGIRRGAAHDRREDRRGRPAGIDAGRMPGAGACTQT